MEQQDRLEEMKKKWQSINVPAPATGGSQYNPSYHTMSNLDRLRRFYRMFLVLAIVWVPLFPFMLQRFSLPAWLLAGGAVYFVVMGCFIWRVYYELRQIDFSTMSAVAVMQSMCTVERWRMLHKVVGMVLALSLVGCMLYYFSGMNEAVFWGGIVGLAVGLAIGIVNSVRSSRWIKAIKRELASVVE